MHARWSKYFIAVCQCLLISVCSLLYFHAYAQKYNFVNYNVENGLIQSQVLDIIQDKDNELWLATFGGVSRFDGTAFKNYDKSNGLPGNIISAIKKDKQGNIWIATNNGVVKFDGIRFKIFPPETPSPANVIGQLAVDAENHICGNSGISMFSFNGKKFELVKGIDSVIAINTDANGKLYAATFRRGLLRYDQHQWHAITDSSGKSDYIVFNMWSSAEKTLKCLTNKGIYEVRNNVLCKLQYHFPLQGIPFTSKIFEDSHGIIWCSLGDGGVWQYQHEKWTHFNYQNGLSDENFNTFFEDKEGNIWLGSNGSGLFRYASNNFIYYDRSSSMAYSSITTITQNPITGIVYVNGGNFGLYAVGNNTPSSIPIDKNIGKITSAAADDNGKIWIASANNGLWYYDGLRTKKFYQKNLKDFLFMRLLCYQSHKLWISSAVTGDLFKLEGDSISRQHTGIEDLVSAMLPMGNDTLLLGTISNAYIYNTVSGKLSILFKNINAVCFTHDSANIYIGTDDRGVIQWNMAQQKFKVIGVKDGLSCNYVYNIICDNDGNIWAGTGCGIDKISIKDGSVFIKSFGKSDGLIGVENNVNASLKDKSGALWFGTTRGLFKFNTAISDTVKSAPVVVLQSVKLFSKDLQTNAADSIIPFENIPYDPHFAPAQNHLTFTFKGIYLSNPEKVKYRYQLVGADKSPTETDQNTIVFSNLPSGEYVLKIWASDADGNWYDNALSYPFTIRTPFYKTVWFSILAGMALLGIILLIVYMRNRQKMQRIAWEQRLREEEQARVRQKTAEDFHDEIGNKLTRISLLTTIAESKTNTATGEVKDIFSQIKQNVASLYNGSKDIIWMLQPYSDFLDEILLRMQQIAGELLHGSSIQFAYHLINKNDINLHRKMPIDNSRNIVMIFKETLNNAVKYSEAKNITLTVLIQEDLIKMEISDDGKGFDMNEEHSGNGLKNIRNRAKRIKARLHIQAEKGRGCTTVLMVAMPEEG